MIYNKQKPSPKSGNSFLSSLSLGFNLPSQGNEQFFSRRNVIEVRRR